MFWLVYQIFKEELASFCAMIGLYEWRNNVGFIIAFLATVIISQLSYRFIEKPFLQLKRRFTFIPSRD
jgi:peptidoglycan/LPS O-acetylase OafA/YrhL